MRAYRAGGVGALVVAAAGCFEPSYPVGLLCSPNGECPGNQVCIDDLCVLPSSGPGGVGDAGVDPDGRQPVFYDATPCSPTAADDPTCDGVDDDCDDRFDEDTGDVNVFFRDRDGDTYGLAVTLVESCGQPTGYVGRAGDCWDSVDEPWRSINAHPAQTAMQPGVMAESTTGLLGDWNCDGEVVYEETQCSEQCAPHPACIYYYEGWLSAFAECGETREFCSAYDEYDHFCMESEPREQRCL